MRIIKDSASPKDLRTKNFPKLSPKILGERLEILSDLRKNLLSKIIEDDSKENMRVEGNSKDLFEAFEILQANKISRDSRIKLKVVEQMIEEIMEDLRKKSK